MSTNDSNIWNLCLLTDRPNLTFVLANEVARGQTDGIMKNFPGTKTFALIATGIIALFLIQACAPFSFVNFEQGLYGLIIKMPRKIKDKDKFEKALLSVQHDGVSYHFELVLGDGTHVPYQYGPDVVITTDKVVTTQLAKSLAKDGSHPNGPSLTHHIYSTASKDITTVANEVEK